MACKKIMSLTLALAAIAPAALVGCGGSPATPTIGSSTPGAQAPITGTLPARTPNTAPNGTLPTAVPTAEGNAPPPLGTGVPAGLPTQQP